MIQGGTVLTASHGPIENGYVLVVDGKIAQIAAQAVTPPPGARVIDARGKFVTPGIIDAHSHMGVYPWTVARSGNSDGNEATSPITPDVRAEDAFLLEDPALERARAGGVTAILALPGSANLIGGEGVVVKLRRANTLAGMKLEGAPRQLKMAMGENPKRVYGGRTQLPSTRMGNLALLREAFGAAKASAERVPAALRDELFLHPPLRPAHLPVLQDVLAKKIRLQVHCYTKSDILALLRLRDEFDLPIAALHHALEAYKVPDELAKRGIGIATFADWWGFKQEAWDAIPENAAPCAKAGVKVAIHSDSSDHVQRLWHEAAKCVAHGMSEEDALRSVTLWPAEILGIGDRTGSIDAGKDADLAIFSRHPFDMLARVDATLVDGKVVFERKEPAPSLEPVAPEAVALIGARVLPVAGPPIEGGTIVIRKGRIESVGRGPSVPADARVIDVRGKTIVPGFIDANTSVGLIEVGLDPSTHDDDESSSVVVPHVRAVDGINPDSETVRVGRSGGVTTVVVAPGEDSLIAGQAAIVDLDGPTVAAMTVREPFALWVNLGPGAIERAAGKGEFTTRMGRMAKLRELLIQAVEHKRKLERHVQEVERWKRGEARRAKKAAERAAAQAASPTAIVKDEKDEEEPPLAPEPPGRDLRKEALMAALEGKVPVVIGAHREIDLRAALALADEFGLRLILNHATEAYRIAPLLAERKIPVILGPVTTQPAHLETWRAIYENATILHKAGVKLALQTGSAHNVRLLPFQAGIAASYGLPLDAALRAITLDAAEILGIAADYGSIEKGKVANLVVLSGDPLEPRSRVEHVFIRGREVPRDSHQDEMLRRFGGGGETK